MNLKLHLLLRITLAACLSAILVTGYVLWRADREAQQHAETAAARIVRQLNLQLLRISTGTDLVERFPDESVFEPSRLLGLCVRLDRTDGRMLKSICTGTNASSKDYPTWFARFYRSLFDPGQEIAYSVSFRNKSHATVVVTPVVEQQLSQAWQTLKDLVSLTSVTLIAVSLIAYISLARLLQPAERMVADIARLQQGDLAHRLVGYDVTEFQRISVMVNRLSIHLEQSLQARAELNAKLVNAHEEERRWLARELHDEVGQCLAGINALAASIGYTAQRECPGLVGEAERIGQTVDYMMGLVHNVLTRLRLPELDMLGLKECMNRLVQHWNERFNGRTQFTFACNGAIDSLPPQLAGHIYRIVQESLSNAARHAAATLVQVRVELQGAAQEATRVAITVVDNGVATAPVTPQAYGIGLRGIHDRVTALGGKLMLTTGTPSGLSLTISVPCMSSPNEFE